MAETARRGAKPLSLTGNSIFGAAFQMLDEIRDSRPGPVGPKRSWCVVSEADGSRFGVIGSEAIMG